MEHETENNDFISEFVAENKDALTVCCEHLAAKSKDIADRDEIIADLLSCLTWYVENDDTNDSEHNAFYLAGLSRAKGAITKATGE